MGHQPQLFPVSVKGVVIRDGRVLLLRNERDEWELPGGKLELGEDPESCVAREITEEVGWAITTGPHSRRLAVPHPRRRGRADRDLRLPHQQRRGTRGQQRAQGSWAVHGQRGGSSADARGLQEVDHGLVPTSRLIGGITGRPRCDARHAGHRKPLERLTAVSRMSRCLRSRTSPPRPTPTALSLVAMDQRPRPNGPRHRRSRCHYPRLPGRNRRQPAPTRRTTRLRRPDWPTAIQNATSCSWWRVRAPNSESPSATSYPTSDWPAPPGGPEGRCGSPNDSTNRSCSLSRCGFTATSYERLTT